VFSSNDYGVDLEIGTDNSIFITGVVFIPTTLKFGLMVLKYDSEGDLQYSYLDSTSTNSYIASVAKTVDGDNLFVASTFQKADNTTDIKITSLDGSGILDWETTYDYDERHDVARFVDIDRNQNVVVSGVSSDQNNLFYANVTLFRGNDGQLLDEGVNGDYEFKEVTDVKKDTEGNIYVAGIIQTTNGNDAKIVKLDSNLNLEWETTFDHQSNKDQFNAIQISNNNDVFCVGFTESSGFSNAIIVLYDDDGTQILNEVLGPEGVLKERAIDLVLDDNENLVIGIETQNGTNKGVKITTVNQQAEQLWSKTINNGARLVLQSLTAKNDAVIVNAIETKQN
jgi:hypothetical protein